MSTVKDCCFKNSPNNLNILTANSPELKNYNIGKIVNVNTRDSWEKDVIVLKIPEDQESVSEGI